MKPNVISRSFFVLAIMLIGAFSVTPAEAQTQLIQNSSFETLSPSMAPWYTQNSTAGWWNINNSAGAHSGNRYEYIGVGSDGVTTANNVEDVLYQDVAIPSGTTSSTAGRLRHAPGKGSFFSGETCSLRFMALCSAVALANIAVEMLYSPGSTKKN